MGRRLSNAVRGRSSFENGTSFQALDGLACRFRDPAGRHTLTKMEAEVMCQLRMKMYSVNSSCVLNHDGKLIVNDVHLFNCSDNGVKLINTAMELSTKNGGFTAKDLLHSFCGTKLLGDLENSEEIHHWMRICDYLLNVGVLNVKQQQLFYVADNDQAREIVRNAITNSDGTKMLIEEA